jgi:hypothetical protein
VTLRIKVTLIAPDLRFALRSAIAKPGTAVRLADLVARADSALPPELPVSTYLRYADQDAMITVEGVSAQNELEQRLGAHLQTMHGPDELSDAVVALDAVDWCFRHSGLWAGNIYLAGAQSLAAVVNLTGGVSMSDQTAEGVARELAALELAYLFPIASRFRRGAYDGQVQFRLNGWGRSLAARFSPTAPATTRSAAYRCLLSAHLASEFRRYESFLRQLDLTRQSYQNDLLEHAMSLPIPVLV